ncbi:MAG: hypothetical protein ABIO16_07355 [Nocardioides sp.]
MPEDELDRRDYEALLATRGELGPEYDKALVDSFADRMEREIQRRSASASGGRSVRDRAAEAAGKRQMTLGIVSLGAGIPITAISAGIEHLPGLLVAWAGIAAVNVAHALQNRRRD